MPQYGIADFASGVIKIDVNTFRAGGRKRFIKTFNPVVNGMVVLKYVTAKPNLFGPASDAHCTALLDPCYLTNT